MYYRRYSIYSIFATLGALLLIFILQVINFLFLAKSYSITCPYSECVLKEKSGIFTPYKEIYKFKRNNIEEIAAEKSGNMYVPVLIFKDGSEDYKMPFVYYNSSGLEEMEEFAQNIMSTKHFKFSNEKNIFSYFTNGNYFL